MDFPGKVSLLYIDGVLRPAADDRRYPNVSPSSGQVLGHAADGAAADMDAAIAAARRAFDAGTWSRDIALRLRCLTAFRDALRAHRDQLADLAVADTGAALGCIPGPQCDLPLAFLDYPLELLASYAWEEELPIADTLGTPSRRLIWKEAFGVVGAISPWNVPTQINLAKIFPALAAGCTVVLKPAPETPWTAALLGEIAAGVGLPAGVFNVVTSSHPSEVGEMLVTDPRVDMISFTGSTATGRHIMAAAATTLKKVFLELGGKSANIILDDADFAQVLPMAAFPVLYHAGQGCACLTRLLLPRSRYEEGLAILRSVFEAFPYGDPDDPTQIMGPLISQRHRDRVLSYIEIGKAEGARLLTGGGIPSHLDGGYYVEPTIFADVDNAMRIAQEEIFGPVLVVIPYDTDADAVRIANDSIFGLSGGVVSASEERGIAIARQIRAGTFSVNGGTYFAGDMPFGGYKQSGLGREMGVAGFEEYLQTKAVGLNAGPASRTPQVVPE